MITLNTHIKITKAITDDKPVDSVVKSLSPSEKLNFFRNVENVYPLEDTLRPSEEFYNDFKIYDNVMDLHFGQFIMLEQYITSGKIKYQSDKDYEIAKLLLRPAHHKEFDNENPREEQENSQKILESSVQDVYGSIYKYMEDREDTIFNQFSGVFYNRDNEDEEDEEENTEVNGEELFHTQWYWYSMVRMLAQEDIRRYPEIYMLKMNVILPEMSYISQKNKLDRIRERRDRALQKL
jgi:hypothetical protein